MQVSRNDFDWAVTQGLLSVEQSESLWNALESRDASHPRFDIAHIMYYFGALVVISAMGCFMTLGWETFGGGGIMSISAVYALCFGLAGRTLWFKQNLTIPGGLLFTMAVCMTPLAVYGFERMIGLWPQGDPGTYRDFHVFVKGGWFFMEVATIIAALVALRFVRFPFLTAPIAFALWYMSMDLTPLLFGRPEFSWNERLWVSVCFGLVVLLVSFLVDCRTKDDYSFWGYLFGMLAFWFGLSLMENGSELSKFFYCPINVGLVLISVLLQRRVFIVFGALGVFGYLGYLSYRVFQNSLLFPVALSFIGVLVMFLGIKYQRNRATIEQFILVRVPLSVKRVLPSQRGGR